MRGKQKSRSKKKPANKTAAPPGIPDGVTSESFVGHWNTALTLKQFSESLGVSASTCALYAARLRAAGHELKWFRKGRPRLLEI